MSKCTPEFLNALKLADEMASALESVLEEIDQSGQSHVLGSCYETSKRILSTWWAVSGAATSKATGEAQ